VEEEQIREYLSKLDIHRSMDPDGMHPRTLRKLADVLVRSFSMVFEQL